MKVRTMCPYCGAESKKVTGRAIYPHRPDLYRKTFYQCAPCDAYVGCHPGTVKALGRLANAELRKAKSAAHRAFDDIWRNKHMSRSQAYSWLAASLGIEKKDCHIGMFDVDMCMHVVAVSESYLADADLA
jgi:hypothetical protein